LNMNQSPNPGTSVDLHTRLSVIPIELPFHTQGKS